MTSRSHCAQLLGKLRLQQPREATGEAVATSESMESARMARLNPAAEAGELVWEEQATASDER